MDLSKILKGHEGETFYSPTFGYIKYLYPDKDGNGEISLIFDDYLNNICLTKDGRYCEDGELIIFPSKNQRDWKQWSKEQKSKGPKTWNDVVKNKLNEKLNSGLINKAAEALVKIYQLIELCYGGIPTKDERSDETISLYAPYFNTTECKWKVAECIEYNEPIAFHTEEQCLEFLNYAENIQLLEDYYML